MLTDQTIKPTDQTIEPTDQTDRPTDLWGSQQQSPLKQEPGGAMLTDQTLEPTDQTIEPTESDQRANRSDRPVAHRLAANRNVH